MEYVQKGLDGKIAVITTDSSAVAESLQRHDPCLQLWYLEDIYEDAPPVYAVFRVHINERPCSVEEMRDAGLEPEFVLSALECDQRIVRQIEEIDPRGRSGYDFVAEVERRNREAEDRKRKERAEKVEEHGEELAHAIRADMGTRYKGRATPHRFGRPGWTAKT
jgi:hypothetical protein